MRLTAKRFTERRAEPGQRRDGGLRLVIVMRQTERRRRYGREEQAA
jgi:hypothetical protein